MLNRLQAQKIFLLTLGLVFVCNLLVAPFAAAQSVGSGGSATPLFEALDEAAESAEPAPGFGPAMEAREQQSAGRGAGTPAEIIPNPEDWIYSAVLKIGGYLVITSGLVFDFAIQELVIEMGDYLRSNVGWAVDTLWAVIRDIFNLLFIFGLLYIGFKTILNAEDTGTRKALGLLIIAALLMNFSLFFTKVIVDVSNRTADVIHTSLKEAAVQQDFSGFGFSVETSESFNESASISGAFMEGFRLSSFAAQAQVKKEGGEYASIRLSFAIILFILMLTATFVFAAGAFLLVARFVTLIIFMIFSPVMFLGWILPMFQKLQNGWWSTFLRYAFVAPMYLFMLLLSLHIIHALGANTTFDPTTGTMKIADTLNVSSVASGAFAVYLYFFLIAAFLIASLIVARQMSVYGATGSISMMNSAASWAGRTAKRGAGAAGRGATYLPRWMVRQDLNEAGEKWEKGLGKWQSRGSGPLRRSVTLDRAVRGVTKKMQEAKMGTGHTKKENEEYRRKLNQNAVATAKANEREEQIHTGQELAQKAADGTFPQTDAERTKFTDAMTNLNNAVKGLTEKQLTEDIDVKVLADKHVAVHLTSKQIETLEKSGKFTEEQIGQIKQKRKEGLIEIAKNDGGAANLVRNPESLAQRGTDELSKMPDEVFQERAMASFITPSIVEAKIKGGIGTDALAGIKTNIETEMTELQRQNSQQAGPYIKQWRNWQERSTFGARMSLSIPNTAQQRTAQPATNQGFVGDGQAQQAQQNTRDFYQSRNGGNA